MGGLLSGKHKFAQMETGDIEKGGRFEGDSLWAKAYKNRFWQKSKFAGIEVIGAALAKAYGRGEDGQPKVSMVSASLRWLMRHSLLRKGDGVIMGPSSPAYFAQNLEAMECTEDLDADVLAAFDAAWQGCKQDCPAYFR